MDMPLAHTALCITTRLTLDCSPPLYFSMHVNEKASKVRVKHTGLGGGKALSSEARQTKKRESHTKTSLEKTGFTRPLPSLIALLLTALPLD